MQKLSLKLLAKLGLPQEHSGQEHIFVEQDLDVRTAVELSANPRYPRSGRSEPTQRSGRGTNKQIVAAIKSASAGPGRDKLSNDEIISPAEQELTTAAT